MLRVRRNAQDSLIGDSGLKHDRLARVGERIREELGMGLYRVGMGENVRKERLSFIDARVSSDLHQAIVSVSVLSDPAADEAANERDASALMNWLRDHRADFQKLIAEKVGLKYTPVLVFKRTNAIENGARVLDILDSLDTPEG